MKNYKKIILNNGIPLYLYNDPSLKRVFVNYIIKYGSSGEFFNFNLNGKDYHVLPGHAHFLEHLFYEHSIHGDLINNFFEKCYDANAFTYMNHTSYYFCGVKDIKKSIKELIEAIDIPVFDYKDVNQSRQAIEEESASEQDDIEDSSFSLVTKNLYKDFDLYDDTLSPIGDRSTTKKITTRDLKTCYNAFYTDDKKALVIAGNVNEQELVDYLNEIYSNIPQHKSNLILPKFDYDPIRKKEDVIEKRSSYDFDTIGFKIKTPEGVSLRELYFVTEILAAYLLYKNDFSDDLKSKRLLDTSQDIYMETIDKYLNLIQSYVSQKPEEYFKRLLDKLNKRDLSKEDFELIKKECISSELIDLDDKYSAPSYFENKMHYSEDYSEVDFYRQFDYDRCRDILSKLNFDTYSKVKVKKR